MLKYSTIAALVTVALASCGGSPGDAGSGGDGGYTHAVAWAEQAMGKEFKKNGVPTRVSDFNCVRTSTHQATCDFTATPTGRLRCLHPAVCSKELSIIVQFDGNGVRWEEQ
jgi:hypothetical protein